jgi:hypothetical protein
MEWGWSIFEAKKEENQYIPAYLQTESLKAGTPSHDKTLMKRTQYFHSDHKANSKNGKH